MPYSPPNLKLKKKNLVKHFIRVSLIQLYSNAFVAPINSARIITFVNGSAFSRIYKQVIPQSSKPTSSLNLVLTQQEAIFPQNKIKQMDRVTKLASQHAVVIFGTSSCCMSHTVTRLFVDLGVNPTVSELDNDLRGKEMEKALGKLLGRNPAVPAIFIGGKLVGSTDKIMSLHLSGNLVPMLQNAGAIWV